MPDPIVTIRAIVSAFGEAITEARSLTQADFTLVPPPLCRHHGLVLGTWRETHGHESSEDYARRVADVARACPECGEAGT